MRRSRQDILLENKINRIVNEELYDAMYGSPSRMRITESHLRQMIEEAIDEELAVWNALKNSNLGRAVGKGVQMASRFGNKAANAVGQGVQMAKQDWKSFNDAAKDDAKKIGQKVARAGQQIGQRVARAGKAGVKRAYGAATLVPHALSHGLGQMDKRVREW